jgi:predicted RNA-binding Zn-ribbon protein involved in translation (DUF1610 family)
MNVDKQMLRIPCPECGKVIEETIENARREMKVFCYSCGAFINVDAQYLKRVIDDISAA